MMAVYPTSLSDREYKEKLEAVCFLLTNTVMDDFKEGVQAGIKAKEGRAKQPLRAELPTGHCTWSYECNKEIKHWRYLKDRGKWIPVCRSHRLYPT